MRKINMLSLENKLPRIATTRSLNRKFWVPQKLSASIHPLQTHYSELYVSHSLAFCRVLPARRQTKFKFAYTGKQPQGKSSFRSLGLWTLTFP